MSELIRIILAPDTAAAAAIRDVLIEWSGDGLVDDFCWVTLTADLVARPELPVLKVGDGVAAEAPLGEAILGCGYPRLVAFYPMDRTDHFAGEFGDLVSAFSDKSRTVAAYNSEKHAEPALVLAVQDFEQEIPQAVLTPGLVPIFMIAIEDRPDPTQSDLLSTDSARFAPHGAHGLASTTDLWKGALDAGEGLIETFQMSNPADIRLVRSFSRGIDLGEFLDELGEEVFDLSGGLPVPSNSRLETIGDEKELVRRLTGWADAFAEEHKSQLACTHYEKQKLKAETVYRFPADAFTEIGRLVKVFFTELPRLVQIAGRRAGTGVQESLYVLVGGRSANLLLEKESESLVVDEEYIRRTLDENFVELWREVYRNGYPSEPDERASSTDQGAAQAWEQMWFGALSLLDGSAGPEFATEFVNLPNGAKRLLVDNPTLVVPPPFPPALGLSPADESRACDPRNRRFISGDQGHSVVAGQRESSIHAESTPADSNQGDLPLQGTSSATTYGDGQNTAANSPTTDSEETEATSSAELSAQPEALKAIDDAHNDADEATEIDVKPTEPETVEVDANLRSVETEVDNAELNSRAQKQAEFERASTSMVWSIGSHINGAIRDAIWARETLEAELQAEAEAEPEAEAPVPTRSLFWARLRSFLILGVAIGLGYFCWTRLSGNYRWVAIALLVFLVIRAHISSARRSLRFVTDEDDEGDLRTIWSRDLNEMVNQMNRISLAIAICAGVAIYLIIKYLPFDDTKKTIAVIAVVLLALIGIARAFLERVVRRQQINRTFAQQVLDKWNRRRILTLKAGSLPRLERRYREYLDWSEAIGWLAHHPILGDFSEDNRASSRIRVDTSPACMEFRGARTYAARSSLAAPIRSQVFDAGWMKNIGKRVTNSVNNDLVRFGVDNSTGFFSDTGSSENGPRRLLLTALREGRDRHISQVPQSETFFNQVKSRNVDEWISDCPLILPPLEPIPEIASLTRAAHGSSVWIESWVGRRRTVTAGVVTAADQVITCRHPLGEAESIKVTDSTGRESLAIVANLCEGADLVELYVEGLGASPAGLVEVDQAADESVQKRVFGLMKERGASQVAGPVLGEVVAWSRYLDVPDLLARAHKKTPVHEIVFERDSGCPGMPVFSSTGEVVGIQTDDSTARPDDATGCYRRYVVPAATIASFLKDPNAVIDHGLAFEQVQAGVDSSQHGDQPQAFLGTLINVPTVNLFMRPEHWKQGQESQGEIRDVWPYGNSWPMTVEEASAGALKFGSDLRFVIRRVELTAAVPWDELKIIGDAPTPRATNRDADAVKSYSEPDDAPPSLLG